MPQLEWLRYTAFLVLYPIGLIGELGVIHATIFDITEPCESLKNPKLKISNLLLL